MYKNLRWKLLTILGVALVAAVAFYPPSLWGKKEAHLSLGLDLRGGLGCILRQSIEARLQVVAELGENMRERGLRGRVELADAAQQLICNASARIGDGARHC